MLRSVPTKVTGLTRDLMLRFLVKVCEMEGKERFSLEWLG